MPEKGITGESWSVDRDPTIDELQQLEPVDPRVRVDVDGPVRTQQLGAVDGSIRGVVVDDVNGGKLVNHDDRRSVLTIIPYDQPIYLGMTQSEVQASNAAPIAKGVPVTLHGVRRLYARSATPGSSATVTVIAEQMSR